MNFQLVPALTLGSVALMPDRPRQVKALSINDRQRELEHCRRALRTRSKPIRRGMDLARLTDTDQPRSFVTCSSDHLDSVTFPNLPLSRDINP